VATPVVNEKPAMSAKTVEQPKPRPAPAKHQPSTNGNGKKPTGVVEEKAQVGTVTSTTGSSHHTEPVEAEPTPHGPLADTDLARDFADLCSEYLEAPWEFFYFSFLTYLGAIVSYKVTLSSSLKIQPRLYTLLLGGSGNMRKSTAQDKAAEFFLGNLPG
jgi:hypothetical protein